MPSLPLPLLSTIAAVATDRPLSDPSLSRAPIALGLPSLTSSFNIPDPANPGATLGSFAVSFGEKTSVSIINSTTDPDPTGYFNLGANATPAAENPADAPILEPPIAYDPTLAYVVITGLAVTGKLTDSFSIGQPTTLGLTGSGELDVSACMAFPRNAMTWASLSAAAGNFRTMFSVEDLLPPAPPRPVLALPQVLSFGVQTELSLSVTVTASSLASAVADSVSAVLNQSGPFLFTAGPSATVTLSANATDGFRIFSQRAAGGTLFSIKKSLSTCLGLNANVGLTIGIADTALNDLVNSVFDQLAGVAVGTVQSILTPGSGAGSVLTPAQQQALQQVVGKLGISSTVTSDVQSLQSKLGAYKSDLTNRLRLTVSAQFSYSWQRLTSQSLVAQFTVPDAVLPKYHGDVLSLDLTRLMSAGAADGVVFSRMLGQQTLEVDIGYGFSFGIAGYTFLKGWESLKEKFVELDSIGAGGTALTKYSFLGKRGYDGTWLNTSQQNYVELDATTLSPSPSPDACDFQAGLSVVFTWKNLNFQNILNTVCDFGAVIGAFMTDDVVAASQSLVAAGLQVNATGDAVVSMNVSDMVLRQLLPILAGPDYRAQIAPYAMARALPFYEPYAERSQVNLRTQTYGQMFFCFLGLDPGDLSLNTVARLCASTLSGPSLSVGLASAESQQTFGWTAQGVVGMASQEDLQDAVVNQVPRCFSLLQARAGDFHDVFPSCVSDFSELAAQTYGSRVFAGMLYLAATQCPGWLDRIPRTVAFTWKDGGGTHVVTAKQGSQQ